MESTRFATLCSGSSGNAALIGLGGRYLLADAGASCRNIVGSAARLGVQKDDICGVLITHEHSDHIKGLNVFLKHTGVPVFATSATLDYLWQMDVLPAGCRMVATDEGAFEHEGFVIESFATSHDAAGSCGFRVQAGESAMAVCTDLGMMSEHVFRYLQGASLVALEANYDPVMLKTGPYPAYLKKRIAGKQGHLSNDESAAAVVALMAGGCRHVVLVHLSEENNRPDAALTAVGAAFEQSGRELSPGCSVTVARRYEPGDWIAF